MHDAQNDRGTDSMSHPGVPQPQSIPSIRERTPTHPPAPVDPTGILPAPQQPPQPYVASYVPYPVPTMRNGFGIASPTLALAGVVLGMVRYLIADAAPGVMVLFASGTFVMMIVAEVVCYIAAIALAPMGGPCISGDKPPARSALPGACGSGSCF